MSGLPYKFEPGMRVNDITGQEAFVVGGLGDDASHVYVAFGRGWQAWDASCCTADLDHPGTRGLLLQQYRDASGHADAVAVRDNSDGDWIVDSDPSDSSGHVGGLGESEGAAILDALTRLADERARESEQAKSVDGSEAILRHLLSETQAAIEKMVDRLASVEFALSNDRLDRIEARLRRIEDGHV